MNAIVKKIAAAATAFALAAAVTLSAADAPTASNAVDLAAAGLDLQAANYAVGMGADFAAEDSTQTAFLFSLIMAIIGLTVGLGTIGIGLGTSAHAGHI